MKVAQFNTAEEVNAFVDTVVLSDTTPIQHNGSEFIVFYEATKDEYEQMFVDRMIDGIGRNLFHEKLRLAALDSEVEKMKELGTNLEGFDDVKKRQKEADRNIKLLEAKLAGVQAWQSTRSK